MDIREAFRQPATVYGGTEPAEYRLVRTYRAWRADGRTATEALERARNGAARYPSTGADSFGATFGDGLRWIERPESAGFRFVGFADDVAPRRVDHTGWYTREDGFASGEKLRGAVYQLPARNGRPVYVAGYQEEGFGSEGAAALKLGRLFYGERSDESGCDASRDAASAADGIAERMAEESREYDEAWQAGSRWSDLADDIATMRRSALEILKERRAVKLPPAMCAAVRAKVESLLDSISATRAKREELASGYWNRDAFNEGAGRTVIA